MQEKYYAADPHNLIAIEKGPVFPNDSAQNNVYTRAASALQDWIRNDVVARDPAPSFYAYTQEYTVPSTEERRTRRGFIGAGKLEDYSAGVVFRHEQTLSGPEADRLELLRHTRTHTGQLFMLYSDAERRIDAILAEAASNSAPAIELCDEYGVAHRLWVIAGPERVSAIQQAMADQKLVIANGHHRYETAINYRNERRSQVLHPDANAPYEFAMMTFINTRSEGLTILPTHRVAANLHDFSWPNVRRYLEPWFTTEAFSFQSESERNEARGKFLNPLSGTRARRAIGGYPAAQAVDRPYYVLSLRPRADPSQLPPNFSPRP